MYVVVPMTSLALGFGSCYTEAMVTKTAEEAIGIVEWYAEVMLRIKNHQPTGAAPEAIAAFEDAAEFLEDYGAEWWVHGFPAHDLDQVRDYLKGDAHDQSKVQLRIDGKFRGIS